MPDVFRRLRTWSFYILAADPRFESIVGQIADRRRKLYNSKIECTYYQYLGPKPGKTEDKEETEESNSRPKLESGPVFGGVSNMRLSRQNFSKPDF